MDRIVACGGSLPPPIRRANDAASYDTFIIRGRAEDRASRSQTSSLKPIPSANWLRRFRGQHWWQPWTADLASRWTAFGYRRRMHICGGREARHVELPRQHYRWPTLLATHAHGGLLQS